MYNAQTTADVIKKMLIDKKTTAKKNIKKDIAV